MFADWTGPALVAGLFGPQGLQVSEVEIDLKVNGICRIVMTNSDGLSRIVSGVYRKIGPHRRLCFTWAWQADGVRATRVLWK